MSFRCDRCGVAQPNEKKPNRVVVETRRKEYKLKDGQYSVGTEIVREENLCANCNDLEYFQDKVKKGLGVE